MWERLRFARYAMRFERAFRSDDWRDVKACFTDDAVYVIEGSNSRFDGTYRGPDAIAAVFKTMLDELDRKFDARRPRLAGWVGVKDGVLTLPWKVRYELGDQHVWLTGTSRCRWRDGKIVELRDEMQPDGVQRWAAMVGATTSTY